MSYRFVEIVDLESKNESVYKQAFSILRISLTVLFQKKICQSEQEEQGSAASLDFEEVSFPSRRAQGEERTEGISPGKELGRGQGLAVTQNVPPLTFAGCPSAVAKAMLAHLTIFSPIKISRLPSSQAALAGAALSQENLSWMPNKAVVLNQPLATYFLKESTSSFFLLGSVRKTFPISMPMSLVFGKELSKTPSMSLFISRNTTLHTPVLQRGSNILSHKVKASLEPSQARIPNEGQINLSKKDLQEVTNAPKALKETIVYAATPERIEASKQGFFEQDCIVGKKLGIDPSMGQLRNQEVEKTEAPLYRKETFLEQGEELIPTETVLLKDNQRPIQRGYLEISSATSASLQEEINGIAAPQLPGLAKWAEKTEMEKQPSIQKEHGAVLDMKHQGTSGMQMDLEYKMCFLGQGVSSGLSKNRMDTRKDLRLSESLKLSMSQNCFQEMQSETKGSSFQALGEPFLRIASKLIVGVKGFFSQEQKQARAAALLQREEIEGQAVFPPEFIVKIHAPVEIIENYSGKQSDSGRIYDTFRIIENYSGDGRVAL